MIGADHGDMQQDKLETSFFRISEKGIEKKAGSVIGESRWILYVNYHEIVTFMATPRNLHHLAIGFLASEGFIADITEIASLRVNLQADLAYWLIPALGVEENRKMAVCEEGVGSILMRLTREQVDVPAHRIITSGCGGGTTFDDLSALGQPVESKIKVEWKKILALMQELNASAILYRESRGVHTASIADNEHLLCVEEDVGRHNTLDKVRGACLLRGIDTHDKILVSTGRISSEMITKAAKMHVPIVVSRTSPTSLAIQLAQAWHITLIGYAWAGQMQVYNGIERLVI